MTSDRVGLTELVYGFTATPMRSASEHRRMKMREYNRAWFERHKDTVLAKRKVKADAVKAKRRLEKQRLLLEETGLSEIPDGMKQCRACRKVKARSEFYLRKASSKHGKDTHRIWCKDCEASGNKSSRTRNSRYRKQYMLKEKYGITVEDYNDLLSKQEGRCAICRRLPIEDPMGHDLAVDHDHETGRIRGLLCRHCNIGIGKLGDNISGLELALAYLRKHESASA